MILGVLLPILAALLSLLPTFLVALLSLLMTFTQIGQLCAEAPVRGRAARDVLTPVDATRRSVLTERAGGCQPATAEPATAAAEPSATATATAASSTARRDALDQRHCCH
jgi:hypothetical protein